jgi:hypothetical protein
MTIYTMEAGLELMWMEFQVLGTPEHALEGKTQVVCYLLVTPCSLALCLSDEEDKNFPEGGRSEWANK